MTPREAWAAAIEAAAKAADQRADKCRDYAAQLPNTELRQREIAASADCRSLATAIRSLAPPAEIGTDDADICEVCAQPLKRGDLCSTDTNAGVCHAACLDGSPTVDLETGEPIDGPIPTYPYVPEPPDEADREALAKAMLAALFSPDLDPNNDMPGALASVAIAALRERGWRKVLDTAAALDVLAERARQKEDEGWAAERDDHHAAGELAWAASCYAQAGGTSPAYRHTIPLHPDGWPFSPCWWKPTDQRRDLIRAGALILAEIERLDRASAAPEPPA